MNEEAVGTFEASQLALETREKEETEEEDVIMENADDDVSPEEEATPPDVAMVPVEPCVEEQAEAAATKVIPATSNDINVFVTLPISDD